jgi:hypothetical protein
MEKLKDRREKHKLVQFYKMTKTIDTTLHKLLSTGNIWKYTYQYNTKMVLKKYLILENTSRLEWMDLV